MIWCPRAELQSFCHFLVLTQLLKLNWNVTFEVAEVYQLRLFFLLYYLCFVELLIVKKFVFNTDKRRWRYFYTSNETQLLYFCLLWYCRKIYTTSYWSCIHCIRIWQGIYLGRKATLLLLEKLFSIMYNLPKGGGSQGSSGRQWLLIDRRQC